MLAGQVSVSIPTIARGVIALWKSKHGIQAEQHEDGWRFIIGSTKTSEKIAKQASKLSGQND